MTLDILEAILTFFSPLIVLGSAIFILLCIGLGWLIATLFVARIGSPGTKVF